MFFTILDFRNATRLFYDPLFDGDPVEVYEPKPGDDLKPDTDESVVQPPEPPDDEDEEKIRKFYVNNVEVEIVAERVQYYDKEKGLVSVSLKDFSKQNLMKAFASLDDFITRWNKAEQKIAIIEELTEQGVFLEELKEQVGKELDPFDLICHVAFDMPPLTRHERANEVKKRNYFAKYGDNARKVLEALLDKYADEGIAAIEPAFDRSKIVDFLKIPPFSDLGAPIQIINEFGGKDGYIQAIRELETHIYSAA